MSIHLQLQEDIFRLGQEQNNKEHSLNIIQGETASQDKKPLGNMISLWIHLLKSVFSDHCVVQLSMYFISLHHARGSWRLIRLIAEPRAAMHL